MTSMVTDGLEAAKKAALEDLQLLATGVIKTDSKSGRRRRKRRRASNKESSNRDEAKLNGNENGSENGPVIEVDISDDESAANRTGSMGDDEYEPESTVGLVKRARHLSEAEAEQMIAIVSRFEQRHDSTQTITGTDPDTEEGINSEPVTETGDTPDEERNKEKDGVDDANAGVENDAVAQEGEEDEDKEQVSVGVSRKKWKEERRNLISKLKGIAPDPSVVEAWDITATDPVLLTSLKCVRNSVSVPANWRQKRKYLQNKRGLEKRTIHLPHYIEQLGIGGVRDAQRDADGKKTLKQKQREKMRAKLNLSLLGSSGGGGEGGDDQSVMEDEQRLHDAFFKYQTKPSLTSLGDLYYELRELQVDRSAFKPGILSQELRDALGMTAPDDPPPWLIGMQRWGPPPAYPGLKIPGLNFPIPRGRVFGFGPGQFGKAPVDAQGRPLYGDVFAEGINFESRDERFDVSEARKAWLWGRARKDVDEGNERERNVRDEGEEGEEVGERQRARDEGMEKEKREKEKEKEKEKAAAISQQYDRQQYPPQQHQQQQHQQHQQAYRVLPERRNAVGQSNVFGSSHVYDVKAGGDGEGGRDGGDDGNDDGDNRRRRGSRRGDGGGDQGDRGGNSRGDGGRKAKFKF